MSHQQQRDFCQKIKRLHPGFFQNCRVLDIGSLDVNGNNRSLFDNCSYTGLDIAPGKNVDIVCKAHEFSEPDESFDFIISCECFEHDIFFEKTLKNIIRILKSKGLFLFTCATTGRGEHGTKRTDIFSSPLTSSIPEWANYYKNITETDVRAAIDVDTIFHEYQFFVQGNDLQFIGFKK